MTLPSSIEAHLSEAGFTQTELLILRCCIDGTPVSLREIAAQTKKSTGVLDQAMKKLMRRKIMVRKKVNGTSKYALASMDAVLQWIEEDVQQKTESLMRKKQDFKTFVQTLQEHEAKPKVEYFQGEEGITQAYNQLLEGKPTELLQFLPLDCHEDTACFSKQRVQCNRERRKRGVKLRVIAHDTVYGKRFKDRDTLEQRETKLVSESRCAIDFEKIISGNTVACFNCAEKSAYFINFPELAQSERSMFEMVWNLDDAIAHKQASEVQKVDKAAALRKGLYDFFCTKKSLASLVGIALTAAVVTGLLYMNNVRLNTQRMRDQVQAIAATAANEISVNDIDAIHNEADIKKPEWEKLITQLQDIRNQNPDVRFVYILRETSDPTIFEFVADADSMDPYAVIDLNNDGIITDADDLNPPGDPYDVSEIPGVIAGLEKPYADPEPFTDKWGTFISGFAPIKDDNGNTVAVLGVDRIAKDVHELTRESFSPILIFGIAFVILILARLFFFYRCTFLLLLSSLKTKSGMYVLLSMIVAAMLITFGMYKYTLEIMKEEMAGRLAAITSTAAPEISYIDIQNVQNGSDMRSESYQRLFNQLNEIRDRNADLNLQYVYIMRPSEEDDYFEFVADADSNYNLPELGDADAPEVLPPGTPYEIELLVPKNEVPLLLSQTLSDTSITTDEWGTYLSTSTPILDAQDNGIAILGVDMAIDEFYERVTDRFKWALWFLLVLTFLFLLNIVRLLLGSND